MAASHPSLSLPQTLITLIKAFQVCPSTCTHLPASTTRSLSSYCILTASKLYRSFSPWVWAIAAIFLETASMAVQLARHTSQQYTPWCLGYLPVIYQLQYVQPHLLNLPISGFQRSAWPSVPLRRGVSSFTLRFVWIHTHSIPRVWMLLKVNPVIVPWPPAIILSETSTVLSAERPSAGNM